ncbi:MAG: phosphatidate cytidylyltransferase [Zoogloeaceae bacterium]|jgi:phosphatidate cytidylyltransferase|nr:phosphatidate cytidylyltransferase [Zoogloeaceae bacterium]
MLKTRILTAVLLLAVFLPALFWLPQAYWALLMALVAALAAWEWGGLAGLQARGRLAFGGLVLGICVAGNFVPHTTPVLRISDFLVLSAFLFWILALPFWLWRRWRPGKIVLLCLGLVLLCATWQTFVYWRSVSPWSLLAIMGIAWVADTSAYFAGRAFGGRKLAPNISPGKTWAGVWGALAGVAVYGAILTWQFLPWRWLSSNQIMVRISLLMFAFLALSILGILGDLLESLLKRQAGLKDSSAILPGHGGVLDRVDSMMAILPCSLYFFNLPLGVRYYWWSPAY